MPYKLTLDAEEILRLDEYFTRRVGYIGHDDEVDEAAQTLSRCLAAAAEDIRIQRELESRSRNAETNT